MSFYTQLKQEIKEKRKNDTISKNNLIQLEQAIFKDLPKQCRRCGSEDSLTLDHIVPRDLLRSFGVDVDREIVEGNYHILCYRCNSFKGNRLDFIYPETKEILINLLEKICTQQKNK